MRDNLSVRRRGLAVSSELSLSSIPTRCLKRRLLSPPPLIYPLLVVANRRAVVRRKKHKFSMTRRAFVGIDLKIEWRT
jgi:hypothetical protein